MHLHRQNFISADGKTARDSYGHFFIVGETVKHDDGDAGIATIVSFEPDANRNEIRVNTDKGFAYLEFISKL